MIDENGLRPRAVVISAAAALVVCYFVLRVLSDRGGSLPQNSWLTVAVLVVAAGAVLGSAWPVRSYVQGTSTTPPTPQAARIVLVAARACAVAGGLATGLYAAEALVRVPNMEVPSQASAMWLAVVLAAASVVLAVAGMVAQSWCRIPPEDDDRSRENGTAPTI